MALPQVLGCATPTNSSTASRPSGHLPFRPSGHLPLSGLYNTQAPHSALTAPPSGGLRTRIQRQAGRHTPPAPLPVPSEPARHVKQDSDGMIDYPEYTLTQQPSCPTNKDHLTQLFGALALATKSCEEIDAEGTIDKHSGHFLMSGTVELADDLVVRIGK